MLIKVGIDELLGQENLAYNVYDDCGTLLYPAGERVRRSSLKQCARRSGLFRMQDMLSLEWLIRKEMPDFDNAEALGQMLCSTSAVHLKDETEAPALLNETEAGRFIDALFYFWQRLENGQEMDLALLEVMGDALISKVIDRTDQLQYMNQLRLRDGVTYSHTLDVTAVSIALGSALGINGADLKALALGAMLHDLGKLYIPKSIMFKTTRLTEKEFTIMQRHPEIGYHILRDELKLPEAVARPALEHQEQYAGGGYPQNLRGDAIHYFSQIVKIADVYDALTSKRPYKEAICSTQAIKIMLLEGSKSFHPEIFRTFLKVANFPEPVPETF